MTITALTSSAQAFTLRHANRDLLELLRESGCFGEYAAELADVFMRALAWVSAYTYCQLFLTAPTAQVADRVYRSKPIQDELRATVIRVTRRVMLL